MERLQMLDDVRNYANLLMQQDNSLNYAEATKKAKLELFGTELNITSYVEEEEIITKEIEETVTYTAIAEKELGDKIRIGLYTEEQLKEILIAKRMGVPVEEFVNIFYTPKQLRVITMASSLGQDIKPYTTNLYFDADEEMAKLQGLGEQNINSPKTYKIEPDY